MDTNDDLVEQHEDLLADVREFVLRYLAGLKFDKRLPQQIYTVCLYCRLIELAHAAEVLFRENALAGVPIILRSMFEADVDMTNVLADPNYHKQKYLSFLVENTRLLEAAKPAKSPNPFLSPIAKIHDVDQDLANMKAEISKLQTQGIRNLSIRKRAEKASKLNEYVFVYNLLCRFSHNNIDKLEDAHIVLRSPGQHEVVVLAQKKGEYVVYINAIVGYLLANTAEVGKFLGGGSIDGEKCVCEFRRLQAAIQSEAQKQIGIISPGKST